MLGILTQTNCATYIFRSQEKTCCHQYSANHVIMTRVVQPLTSLRDRLLLPLLSRLFLAFFFFFTFGVSFSEMSSSSSSTDHRNKLRCVIIKCHSPQNPEPITVMVHILNNAKAPLYTISQTLSAAGDQIRRNLCDVSLPIEKNK